MTTTYDLDRLGTPFRSLLITERLSKELEIPVLAMSDPQIPAGAIGGNVTSIDAYARKTQELIQQIVADAEFATEPMSAETNFLFNGEQLDRFGISRSVLPENSVILNETPNIWRDYGNWILPGLALIVIQGFLIAGLLDCCTRDEIDFLLKPNWSESIRWRRWGHWLEGSLTTSITC